MLSSEFDDCDSKNYDVVTFDVLFYLIQVRVELIKLVCEQKFKISQAARVLHVNESTAKYIVRSFRKNGKILKKTQRNQQISEKCLREIEQLQ